MLVKAERTCRKCSETKPIEDFYVIKGKPEWTCKACKIGDGAPGRRA